MKIKPLSRSLILAAMLAGAGLAPAMAQNTYTPGIDRAQQEIRADVQRGVASGRITQAESQEFYARERSIQFREIRMKNDGRASPQEREQLRRDLDALRADVDRQLSNDRFGGRPQTPGIDQRQERASQRIDDAVASGRLTRSEAQRLHKRERGIERMEERFRADGKVTKSERDKLRDEQRALNNEIDRLVHNPRRDMR